MACQYSEDVNWTEWRRPWRESLALDLPPFKMILRHHSLPRVLKVVSNILHPAHCLFEALIIRIGIRITLSYPGYHREVVQDACTLLFTMALLKDQLFNIFAMALVRESVLSGRRFHAIGAKMAQFRNSLWPPSCGGDQ